MNETVFDETGKEPALTPLEVIQWLGQAGLRPPKMLTLSITGACNLACLHCWVRAGEVSSDAHVPLSELRRIVEGFAALGGEGIRITGGEPLCHPGWLDLVKLSSSVGIANVALQTNAMLVGDEQVATLRDLDFPGLSIQVSLDGATAQTHDLVRGEGAFASAVQGIMKLVQGGFARQVSIFFTEMRHNLEEIPALLDFADSLGIGSVSTGAMVGCGRAAETSLLAPPATEQYLRLLERYDSDPRFRELYGKMGTVAALEWRTEQAARQGCCTFVENPYLTPSGVLYPCLLCHADEYSVSGVFDMGLAAAFVEGIPRWSSLLRLSCSRSDANPECRDCPGKLSCSGGCMGRAWGSFGNLQAVDDRCQVRRIIYELGGASRY